MLPLLATLALWLAVAGCAQVPLVSTVELASARSSWTDAPSPDSTAADVFSSMNSLLQFWPNTIFRTGHTLVPSTIPAGTILHHGSYFPNATVPTSFEWLAFDFEHAYIFCVWDCHVFKFVAYRDLKVLYLDGASAANWIGAMQTIDVLLYGEVPEPARDWEEWPRAKALCDWGVPLGLDGFVRMEFHLYVLFHQDLLYVFNWPLTRSIQRSHILQLHQRPHPSRDSPRHTQDATARDPAESTARHEPHRPARRVDWHSTRLRHYVHSSHHRG